MEVRGAKQVSSIATPAQGSGTSVAQTVTPSPAPGSPVQERPQPKIQPAVQRTLAEVAAYLREYLNSARRDLEFHVDQDANATVIIVRNASTGEVVRQIPNEEALRMLRHLNEGSATLLDLTV
jgi:flagellar protein FlaG